MPHVRPRGERRPAITIAATPVHQHVTAPSEQEAPGACGETLRSPCVATAALSSTRPSTRASRRLLAWVRELAELFGRLSSYLDWIIDGLRCRYDLRSKRVVEAGCGQGYLSGAPGRPHGLRRRRLRSQLRPRPPHDTAGPSFHHSDRFDPQPPRRGRRRRLRAPRDRAPHAATRPTSDAARSSAERGGAVWLETPRLEWILERGAYWDIFYEHCSYFFMPVLASMMAACGLRVTHHASTFGDQYQWIEGASMLLPDGRRPLCVSTCPRRPPSRESRCEPRGRLAAVARRLADSPRARLGPWECVLWGAGAKGVTFLNHLDASRDLVSAVVDINPASKIGSSRERGSRSWHRLPSRAERWPPSSSRTQSTPAKSSGRYARSSATPWLCCWSPPRDLHAHRPRRRLHRRSGPHSDDRGAYTRTWCAREFAAHGLNVSLAQSGLSYNRRRGTPSRHAHADGPACADATRPLRPRRDLRRDHRPQTRLPTYCRWLAAELRASSRAMHYVPEGFAHGFQTLRETTPKWSTI